MSEGMVDCNNCGKMIDGSAESTVWDESGSYAWCAECIQEKQDEADALSHAELAGHLDSASKAGAIDFFVADRIAGILRGLDNVEAQP